MIKSNKHGVILSRVTSALRTSEGKWVYNLSTGQKLRFASETLQVRQWYFFELKTDVLGNQSFISCENVSTQSAEKFSEELLEMQGVVNDVTKMWAGLNASDRQLMMRELGIYSSGALAASALYGGVAGLGEALVAESILGAATGGLSLLVGGVFAGLTYLQYEEKKAAIARHQALLERFRLRRDILARLMIRMAPAKYSHLSLLDPQVESIVTRLRVMIGNIDFSNLFAVNDRQYAYAGA